MPRLALACAAVLFAMATSPAAADTWMAPMPQVAASQDGRYYVISNPRDGWRGVDLLLVRCGPGNAPPTAPERGGATLEESPPIAPTEGDEVIARAEGHTPLSIRCLDGGRGFVLFESWGGLGTATVLAAWDGEGTRRWKRELDDFFTPAEIDEFMHTASSIHWFRGLWIDEERGEVVVVAHGPSLVRVGLADGKKRDGGAYDLLARIGKGPLEQQLVALDAAVDLAAPGALEGARRGYGAEGVPLAVRVRCAVLMAKLGDRSGRDLVAVAAGTGQPPDVRQPALLHLPAVMGAEAIPLLRDALRGPSDPAWSYAESALASLGEAAIPALVEMLGETEATASYRSNAAGALSRMGEGARPAVPALLAMARSPHEYDANTAINALVDILPSAELQPLFVTLLEQGTGDDERLALFFEQHPTKDAVPALVSALERAEVRGSDQLEWFVNALARCARTRGKR